MPCLCRTCCIYMPGCIRILSTVDVLPLNSTSCQLKRRGLPSWFLVASILSRTAMTRRVSCASASVDMPSRFSGQACPQLYSMMINLRKGQRVVRFRSISTAFPIQHWQMELDRLELSVAPLVFRKHAVIVLDAEGQFGILQERNDVIDPIEHESFENWQSPFSRHIRTVASRNFLDLEGNYFVLTAGGSKICMDWVTVHARLLPLGLHIIVEKSKLSDAIQLRLPEAETTHLRGWLRYPDAVDLNCDRNDLVFVAFRVIDRTSNRRSDMEVMFDSTLVHASHALHACHQTSTSIYKHTPLTSCFCVHLYACVLTFACLHARTLGRGRGWHRPRRLHCLRHAVCHPSGRLHRFSICVIRHMRPNGGAQVVLGVCVRVWAANAATG